MHAYYEQNKAKFKKDMNGYLRLIAPELEEVTGLTYPCLLEEIWVVYQKDFLSRFPYIGGHKNSGTKNLTGAFAFVAMGEVCRTNYDMSLEEWGFLTTQCYKRHLERIPSFVRKAAKKVLNHPQIVTKLLIAKDKKNAQNAKNNPGSFLTKTHQPTEEYPVIYHTIVCPLADFASKYGYMDYMPYICNLDYVMFEIIGIPFYRESTCAADDAYCDFKMKAHAPVNSSWPCHSLTPDDPLK